MLREQVGGIYLSAFFLFIGLGAGGIAAIRRRREDRILLWFGIFSVMYGARILAQIPAAFTALPQSIWPNRNDVIAVITYLIIIPGVLFWIELSCGGFRRFLNIALVAAVVVGASGVVIAFLSDSPYRYLPVNNLLAITVLLSLAVVNAAPRLAGRFLVLRSRVAVAGTLVLAVGAVYNNARIFLHLRDYPFFEPLAFVVYVVSLGYVAAEKLSADGRRLLAIENELAIAREIQSSILPTGPPDLKGLRIAATYLPMTAVAGDFYDFISVDSCRAGFLIADVAGHGVPAALIAAMIKVAMQSVLPCAPDPAAVLRGLNRILSGQLRSQFVSAAYMWIDTERQQAFYSAAGHPPLLLWRGGRLERFESNGLLIGVLPDSEFPVCQIPLTPHDRFLLYTDGIVEAENAGGEPFGDARLEQVVRANYARTPAELSQHMVSEIRRWQPAAATQQDDITLVVIDVA